VLDVPLRAAAATQPGNVERTLPIGMSGVWLAGSRAALTCARTNQLASPDSLIDRPMGAVGLPDLFAMRSAPSIDGSAMRLGIVCLAGENLLAQARLADRETRIPRADLRVEVASGPNEPAFLTHLRRCRQGECLVATVAIGSAPGARALPSAGFAAGLVTVCGSRVSVVRAEGLVLPAGGTALDRLSSTN